MMRIRPATSADRSATTELWAECGLTRPWNDADLDFDRAIRGPASTVLVACNDEDAVHGSVMVGADGHRGWIYYLGVSVEMRGTGLGRALMGAAEEWLRQAGMPKVELMVRADNVAAHDFYDALDYESSDVVVRQKWLSAAEAD